jgi:hypothetical protein
MKIQVDKHTKETVFTPQINSLEEMKVTHKFG